MREKGRAYPSKTPKSAQKGEKTLKERVKTCQRGAKGKETCYNHLRHERTRENTVKREAEQQKQQMLQCGRERTHGQWDLMTEIITKRSRRHFSTSDVN